MSKTLLSRRTFVAAGTSAVALATAGGVIHSATAALAEDVQEETTWCGYSLCSGCQARCGFKAYATSDAVGTLLGDEHHPHACGTLCAAGYGYASMPFSKERLTHPLKRLDSGEFEEISWDDALSEIAERVQRILGAQGASALGTIHGIDATSTFYWTRFMQALGSPQVFNSDVGVSPSFAGGCMQTIGVPSFESDIAQASMVLVLGASGADALRPGFIHALEQAHECGARVVYADARRGASFSFADEWAPINPGSELALVLGMAHVLVSKGRYDQEFVNNHTTGASQWFEALEEYTPAWAQAQTGLAATDIERIALQLAQAAPKASISFAGTGSWAGVYHNTGETVRAVCLFNTLLGCWNEVGGAYPVPYRQLQARQDAIQALPDLEEASWAASAYPLAPTWAHNGAMALRGVEEGVIRGLFVQGASLPVDSVTSTKLQELDLLVVVDTCMTQVAQNAHYVLPLCSDIEAASLPEMVWTRQPLVARSAAVVPRQQEQAKTIDELVVALAKACEVDSYFQFTLDEVSEAQLQSVGLSNAALEGCGVVKASDISAYVSAGEWQERIDQVTFASDACESAGISAVPVWTPAFSEIPGDRICVVGGAVPVQTSAVVPTEQQCMIVDKYHLDRAWISTQTAQTIGAAEGEEVEVANLQVQIKMPVHISSCILPSAVYVPDGVYQATGTKPNLVSPTVSSAQFSSGACEVGYGGACTQDAIVTVMKAGA